VRAIRTFVFFHDRPPGEAEWGTRTGSPWPTATVVERLFGTFEDGLAAAGVAPPVSPSGRQASLDVI
jgi:hypothetical protein